MIRFYYQDIERRQTLTRELIALTYNINTRKGGKKKGSELIPFAIDKEIKTFREDFSNYKERVEKIKYIQKLNKA